MATTSPLAQAPFRTDEQQTAKPSRQSDGPASDRALDGDIVDKPPTPLVGNERLTAWCGELQRDGTFDRQEAVDRTQTSELFEYRWMLGLNCANI